MNWIECEKSSPKKGERERERERVEGWIRADLLSGENKGQEKDLTMEISIVARRKLFMLKTGKVLFAMRKVLN
jgi:hypothetical protein